jgi:hypothetical protein
MVEQAKLTDEAKREEEVRRSVHAVVDSPGPLIADPELTGAVPVDMLTLQRTVGNAAVGRLLARSRRVGGGSTGQGDDEFDIGPRVFLRSSASSQSRLSTRNPTPAGQQRVLARDPEGNPEGGGGGEGQAPVQVALPPMPLLVPAKKVAFFDVEAELSGSYLIESGGGGEKGESQRAPEAVPSSNSEGPSAPSDSYDRQHPDKPIKGEVKGKAAPGESAVSIEAKKQIDLLRFEPTFKGGVEVSNKTIKVGVGVEFEGEWKATKATLAPLEFAIIEWKADKTPEFLVASASVGLDFPPKTFPVDGATYSIKPQLKLELKGTPDKTEAAKWVLEHAGELLTAEFATAAGIIVAGLGTIAAAMYQIAHSDEATQRTEPEIKKCRRYCTGFVNAVRGQAAPPGEGGADGFQAGQAWAAGLKDRYGEGAVAEKARDANLYEETWAKFYPGVKQRMIDSYWEEHWVEKKLTGGEGMGAGGFRDFKALLDGWDRG